MGYTLIPYNWKEYIYHRGISWNSQSMFGSGIIPVGREERMTELDNQSSSHLRIHSETDTGEEEPHFDYTVFFRRYIMKLIGNAIKIRFFGYNYPECRIKDCDSGKRNHLQSSLAPQCQETALIV